MKRLLAALLLLVLASACTRGGAPSEPPGTVRFAIAGDPLTLDPLFLHPDAASVEAQLARLVFEPFVDVAPDGRLVPALLREVPTRANGGLSADGRTIVYRLRSGVRWSDGQPVTAADVLFTLHAILDPRNPVQSREGYDIIDRASAPDPLTVVVHLRRAWAPAIATYFSYGAQPQFVVPAHVLAKEAPLARASFGGAPTVGDGPYRFVSWARGEQLAYVANPRYWRGTPRVPRLSVRILTDPSTNLVMLQSGQLDWNLVAPVQLAVVRGDTQLRFVTVPTAVIAGLAINTAHRPLDDVRVRRALAMSIDRAAISDKITLGVYPVTDSLQPRFSWAYDPAVHEPSYNPAAADALLDAAGWRRGADGIRVRNGVPFQLTYVQFPESMTGVRVATTVQAALKARGIVVTVKSVSNAQLFLPVSGTLATGAYDLAYVPWTMGADPDDSAILRCGAPGNVMRWCDPAVDRLEAQALVSTDTAARRALYGSIARRVAASVPIVFLFNARYVYAHRARLGGFEPDAFLPTWNAADWFTGSTQEIYRSTASGSREQESR